MDLADAVQHVLDPRGQEPAIAGENDTERGPGANSPASALSFAVRFTRHARNRMRRLGLDEADVERVVHAAEHEDRDRDGRRRYIGRVGPRIVRVVLALDEPDLVVTVHERGE